MIDRLPHVREPSSGEPDVCVHCREEWVDLLTLYERDECSVRLRAALDAERAALTAAQAEAATMRAWAEEAARAENENADDARRERVAVVAWLRETPYWPDLETVLDDLAERIERGEHRRGETK